MRPIQKYRHKNLDILSNNCLTEVKWNPQIKWNDSVKHLSCELLGITIATIWLVCFCLYYFHLAVATLDKQLPVARVPWWGPEHALSVLMNFTTVKKLFWTCREVDRCFADLANGNIPSPNKWEMQ